MGKKAPETYEESYYTASQWNLVTRKFKKHKLAIASVVVLVLFYFLAVFCEFFSPYLPTTRFSAYLYARPQRVRFIDARGFHLRPFVYAYTRSTDPNTFEKIYAEDLSNPRPIRFFVHGDPYKLWGLFRADIHFFGVDGGPILLFGADNLGRDLVSRNFYGSRVSLSIGLIGVSLSFLLGCILGGISGYYGGRTDTFIQRVIEFLTSIPTVPLWMALSAALPPNWSPIKVYFGITIILSVIGWCGLARVVRGKLLELREEDFVMAAKLVGLPERAIITRHLLPSFVSYLIVSLTLSVPGMIMGETTLSFLGLGIRAPAVSWGTLLQDSQNVRTVLLHPWLFIPVRVRRADGTGVQLCRGWLARRGGSVQVGAVRSWYGNRHQDRSAGSLVLRARRGVRDGLARNGGCHHQRPWNHRADRPPSVRSRERRQAACVRATSRCESPCRWRPRSSHARMRSCTPTRTRTTSE